jgi:hypothetical protein
MPHSITFITTADFQKLIGTGLQFQKYRNGKVYLSIENIHLPTGTICLQ